MHALLETPKPAEDLPVPAAVLHRTVAGDRGGDEPATVGQRLMADIVAEMALPTVHASLRATVGVPAGSTLAGVADAVAELTRRYEALRTRFVQRAGGGLRQILDRHGLLTVAVYDGSGLDLDEAGRRLDEELRRTSLDLATEWPFRALVGAVGDVPLVVALSVSHIAVDGTGLRVLTAELERILAAVAAGREVSPPAAARQPLDESRFERSPEGAGLLAQAERHWADQLAVAPRTMFPADPAPTSGDRFWRASLRSRAVARAAHDLGLRLRTSSSAALLAAEAVVLAHVAGADRCAVQVQAANRSSAEQLRSVANLTAASLAVVDTRPAPLSVTVKRARAAFLAAQRHGVFDPGRVSELRRAAQRRRGAGLDLSCYFNDERPGPSGPSGSPWGARAVEEGAGGSTFAWLDRLAYAECRFFLHVHGDADEVEFRVLGDTAFLPPQRLRALLSGMERLLVWWAVSDGDPLVHPDAVARVTGLRRGDHTGGRVLKDGCWVDLAAVERLVRAAGRGSVREATVRVDARSTQPLLHAHVVTDDPDGVPDLRERCLDLLVDGYRADPRWLAAVAPDRVTAVPAVPDRGDRRPGGRQRRR